ncbi:MAG: DUF309 domain-containing protein [Nitrospirae bacterium]|nr:DUF309 domain-containing protein [Nitrospirota bacterium]
MPPRKRDPDTVGPLAEPPCSPVQARRFAEGVAHFEAGRYFEAHEAWEQAWRLMGDGPEDDAELVLRGLIQLAAALHAGARGRTAAAHRNVDKAAHKLALFPRPFWGWDVAVLLARLPALRGAFPLI